jgi:tRNA (guanine37-N1)-methyltransferase
VGDPESLVNDTFTGELAGCPQFTRPAEFRGMRVPEVLLSGDHARIRQWRRQQAAQRNAQAARRH